MNTNIKAFIIHLARATNRKQQVVNLTASLPIATEIINAVDGETLSSKTVSQFYRRHLHDPPYPFCLSNNEIACFLSHRKAWQEIVHQELDAGFIFEDDAGLNDFFPKSFATVLSHSNLDCFVRFPTRSTGEKGTELFNNGKIQIIAPKLIQRGMVAQYVGRHAAKRLLAVTQQFDRPVDVIIQMRWITGVSVQVVLPSGVNHIAHTLGGSLINQKKSLLEKLNREIRRGIQRFLYKAKIAKHSYRSKRSLDFHDKVKRNGK